MELIEGKIAKIIAASGYEVLFVERKNQDGILTQLAEVRHAFAEPPRRSFENGVV